LYRNRNFFMARAKGSRSFSKAMSLEGRGQARRIKGGRPI
jgi:hypothetical protein